MPDPFSRTALVLGRNAMEKLRGSRVAVFGLGGVGSYAAEALARSGVGALDLVDHDRVSFTNLNRQLYALRSTLGQYKADVAYARILDINPECSVTVRKVFFLPDTLDQFDFSQFQYVVDAIDTVTGKLALVQAAAAAGTPVISCMGTGNKTDPSALRVSDIYRTSVCPLARVIRSECRRRGIPSLKVVWSSEPPHRAPEEESAFREAPETGRRQVPGSTAFVPAAAGLLLAAEVVRDLAGA